MFDDTENNWGMSAALKNMLDWTSRPNVWRGKLVASIGASQDGFGTVSAQHGLRQVLVPSLHLCKYLTSLLDLFGGSSSSKTRSCIPCTQRFQ